MIINGLLYVVKCTFHYIEQPIFLHLQIMNKSDHQRSGHSGSWYSTNSAGQ